MLWYFLSPILLPQNLILWWINTVFAALLKILLREAFTFLWQRSNLLWSPHRLTFWGVKKNLPQGVSRSGLRPFPPKHFLSKNTFWEAKICEPPGWRLQKCSRWLEKDIETWLFLFLWQMGLPNPPPTMCNLHFLFVISKFILKRSGYVLSMELTFQWCSLSVGLKFD